MQKLIHFHMKNDKRICRICDTQDFHPTYTGCEMMFGTRELFEYFQCNQCQCLQISDIPLNLGSYYPNDYYSLVQKKEKENPIKNFILKQRFRNAIFDKGYKINKILSYFIAMPEFIIDYKHNIVNLLKSSSITNYDARFLDIGCGHSSAWLNALSVMGFKNLFGIDPYIGKDKKHGKVKILKKDLIDLEGEFDLITMHHSLEHISDQKLTISLASKLLSKNGTLIIRIPTVSSYVWEKYKEKWVEMDAPRHLYLHSKTSIELLIKQADLEIFREIPEAIDFEFYGSEQYKRNIHLTDSQSHWLTRDNLLFSEEELSDFNKMADEVNRKNEAGRICLFIRKKS